jgi:hypothetical protein
LRLRSAVGEVQAYLRANAASLVDYARRYLRGQRISTAVVESMESMVNRVIGRRMAKKQPMRWSRRGVHLLFQIRAAVLDGRLEHLFQRWYPRFEPAGTPHRLTPPRGLFHFPCRPHETETFSSLAELLPDARYRNCFSWRPSGPRS